MHHDNHYSFASQVVVKEPVLKASSKQQQHKTYQCNKKIIMGVFFDCSGSCLLLSRECRGSGSVSRALAESLSGFTCSIEVIDDQGLCWTSGGKGGTLRGGADADGELLLRSRQQ